MVMIKKGGHKREVSPAKLPKYERMGYVVVEEEKEENKLTDMTKSELYELAQLNDIDGRSEMSKAELLEALKEV